MAETLAADGACTEALKSAGQLRSRNRLRTPETATTVRRNSGKTQDPDGPCAESREQLGGIPMPAAMRAAMPTATLALQRAIGLETDPAVHRFLQQ